VAAGPVTVSAAALSAALRFGEAASSAVGALAVALAAPVAFQAVAVALVGRVIVVVAVALPTDPAYSLPSALAAPVASNAASREP
jgi:hypothetical protein